MLKLVDEMRMASRTDNLRLVRDFITSAAGRTKLSKPDQGKVILAVDEAVSNIIEHAYEYSDEGDISIRVEADEEKLRISITDQGKSFNPNEIPDVDIEAHVRAGRRSGLGIFMIRQIMDEVSYFFKNGFQNELRMVKYFGPEQE